MSVEEILTLLLVVSEILGKLSEYFTWDLWSHVASVRRFYETAG